MAIMLVMAAIVGSGCSEDTRHDELVVEHSLPKMERDQRPNILVVVADDLGYSDIGPFGGEIHTPTLDTLASEGMVLTDYRVHMACSPTRAMLLTGLDSHRVGYGTMTDEFTPETLGQPGYETLLNQEVTTIGQHLQQAGYHTYIAGKWDMGGRGDTALWPVNRGFDESFVLVEGSGSHYTNRGALYGLDFVTYVENDHKVDLPDDFYSSKHYADKMIEFIDRHSTDDQPFFGMLTFTAPHYPLQAPAEYIERYDGVYEVGYETIRQARLHRMRELGIIATDARTAVPNELYPNWDVLSPQMKEIEVRRMQIYAGMVEAMDYHLGRIIDRLKASGEWENTVLFFFSDNGPEGGNPLDWGGTAWYDWAEASFDLSPENMGLKNSYAWTGPGWALVSSTPHRDSKAFPGDGGIRSPAIVSAPGLVQAGSISSAQVNLLDFLPTVLELADVPISEVTALPGRSMVPVFTGKANAIREPGDYLGLELWARRAVIQGDWKITWVNEPWGLEDQWSLYQLSADPAEQNDLAASQPEKLAEMRLLWDEYVKENGVIPISVYPMGYTNSLSHYDWLPPSMRETAD